MVLQSDGSLPVRPEAPHVLAKIICRQLGRQGIIVSNHHTCAAIDNRRVIADTMAQQPETVYEVASLIDPKVTADDVAMLSEHYAELRRLDRMVAPEIAMRAMMATDEHPPISTVLLEPTDHDPKDGLLIVNNLPNVAFERKGDHYEFSLAALRGLADVMHLDGLYPVSGDMLGRAASIRVAAVKLILPGAPDKTGSDAGPDIVRLAA